MARQITIFSLTSALLVLCYLPAFCQQSDVTPARRPLEGRVEMLEQGSVPALPADLGRGAISVSAALPPEFGGTWHGQVLVKKMQTYPELHSDSYAHQFINEISKFVSTGQHGQLMLRFKKDAQGQLSLSSSDVILQGGVRLELDSVKGPALVVRGGSNLPRNALNRVLHLENNVVEQTRIDEVTIVDASQRPVRYGHTEVSATYTMLPNRQMYIKLLNIDYDQNGKPLWKVLLEGTARR